MLEVLKFILNSVIQFISMLFRIDVGFTNLGVVMCICYILFPMLLVIVNFLKSSVMEELNQRYDESRPRESHYAEYHESAPYKNGYLSYSHSFSKSRRRK